MNFTIKNRIIDTENDENLISYNTDYIANFSFDEEWEGTVKTARFIQNGAHEDKVLVNDSCEIPSLKNGVVRIGVFNDTMTSTYKLLKVRNSIKDDSGNPAEPEPDVYAQLISLIQSGMLKGDAGYTPVKGKDYFTDDEVEEIIGRADVFSQKAGESAAAAATSERNAALSEQAAKESAEQSAEAATAADTSKRSADEAAKAAKASEDNAAASERAAEASKTAAATSESNAAASATAAEKSKTDAEALVNRFSDTVSETTAGAVKTVNDTKDAGINEINNLMDTIPEDYTAIAADVDELKSDLINVNNTKADKTALVSTNRRVDAIYKITEGQSWQEETVETESYSNDIPSGSVLAKLKKIGGKSVVWSQLCQNGNFVDTSGWAISGGTMSASDNKLTVINNSESAEYINTAVSFKANHKYLIMFDFTSSSDNTELTSVVVMLSWASDQYVAKKPSSIGKREKLNYIITAKADYNYMYIYPTNGVYIAGYKSIIENVMVVDITSYGDNFTFESFRQRYPNDYYPYCEPTIISSQTDRVDVRGKNLWDEETERGNYDEYGNPTDSSYNLRSKANKYHPIKPNTQYTNVTNNSNGTLYISYYDSTKNYISRVNGVSPNTTFTTPQNARYIRFGIYSGYGIIYKNDIAIIEGKSGLYEPYSLQQIETGFPELNELDSIDNNEGKLITGGAFVDLGMLDYTYNSSLQVMCCSSFKTKYPSVNNLLCSLYHNRKSLVGMPWSEDKQIALNSNDGNTGTTPTGNFNQNTLLIHDASYTDATAFKEAMSGVMLYYELAEEIVTDIEIPAELADYLVVEAGGSITFHNSDEGKRLLIPNTTTYVEKLSEVTNG